MFHSAQQSTRGAGGSVVGETDGGVGGGWGQGRKKQRWEKSSLLNRRLMLGSNQKMEMTQLGVYVDILYLPTPNVCNVGRTTV